MLNIARSTPGDARSPMVRADPLPWTMMPALNSATTMMKKPMPAEMENLSTGGMDVRILFLSPVTVTAMNSTPDMNTAARACS